MPVDTNSVRTALRSVFLTTSGLPSDIAYENRQFTKPNDEDSVWIRETLLPAGETHNATQQTMATGIVQYDVFVKKGGGTKQAEDLAEAIKTVFPPGTSIQHSGVEVSIYRAERGAAQIETAWYMVPVRIFWRVFAQL